MTAGARAPLPVPASLNGALSTSWFREHKTRPETTLFPREGLPGPGHTSGQETPDTQDDLIIRHVTAKDTVLEAGRGRRRATEQLLGKGEWAPRGTEFSGSENSLGKAGGVKRDLESLRNREPSRVEGMGPVRPLAFPCG